MSKKFDKVFNRIISEGLYDDHFRKMKQDNNRRMKDLRSKIEKSRSDLDNSIRSRMGFNKDQKQEKKYPIFTWCKKCREERPSKNNFCEECGSKLVKLENRSGQDVHFAPCGAIDGPICRSCGIIYGPDHKGGCDVCGGPTPCVK